MVAVEHFNADAVEVDDTVSCTFTLNGRDWTCRNRDQIDARVVDSVLSNQAMNVTQFFTHVLVEEDSAEFVALLASDDFPLPLARTRKLMEFLVEQVLNRPTVRPGSSGRGPQITRATSEESSSSRATRRKRSAS